MKYCMIILIITLSVLSELRASDTNRTLHDKIGQMLMIGVDGMTIEPNAPIINAIEQSNVGGVVLFDYNASTHLNDKNIKNPEQVKKLTADLQRINNFANQHHHRLPLPLLIGIDYEGGKVTRLKEAYGFPPTLSAAEVATLPLSEANKVAAKMANTLVSAGFNVNFSPVLDVNINPDNPIIGAKDRSFSNNPNAVSSYAQIYAENFLEHNIQCVYKHFPGHGSSREDSHLGFVDVTKYWQPDELEPYRQLIGNNHACGMIMTAHIVNQTLDESGLPATLSHKILTDILRHQLQYDGVIVSDDMQMSAISEHYSLEQAVTLAINAGVDILLFGNQPQEPGIIINIIEKQVALGNISQDRIEEAYQHILTLKQSMQKV